ncbi:MAG: MlaE family lipid ABC transporter permease subunit [Methylococcus sp.]
MAAPTWTLNPDGEGALRLSLTGDWRLNEAGGLDVDAVMAAVGERSAASLVRVDAAGLGQWDSLLMTFLLDLSRVCERKGLALDVAALPEGVQGLLRLATAVAERKGDRRLATRTFWIAELGEGARNLWQDALFITRFIGEITLTGWSLLRRRPRFRQIDLWLQIQECGPSALPIVALISLLVGLILAFVGAVQLALFGAQIYIADLVGLGMTREMGALMTAIIMAGRSGASFAAQIGSMNVNLEISALRVMGFSPIEFLVLPRMLALILVMPILCLFSDLMGIVGGGLVSISFFDIPLTQYLHRTIESVHLPDFLIGVTKGALFGILIALAGCLRGVQCGRSASAVGTATTSAVVTSIVFIVVADSIVTLICDRLGL